MARVFPKILITLGALAIVVVRLRWPSLGIDLVAVALLVFAAIPWLGGVFRSVPTPWGQLEYWHKIERKVDEAVGAANSTRQIAETGEARDLARFDDGGTSTLIELAATYEATRGSMRPGSTRTDEMTTVVGRMVAAVEHGADIDVEKFLADPIGGRRLAAYVRLYVKPDSTYLLPLVNATVGAEKAFGQYWALRSLSRVVDSDPERVDRNTLRRLTRLSDELPPGSDRRYELDGVLARCP